MCAVMRRLCVAFFALTFRQAPLLLVSRRSSTTDIPCEAIAIRRMVSSS